MLIDDDGNKTEYSRLTGFLVLAICFMLGAVVMAWAVESGNVPRFSKENMCKAAYVPRTNDMNTGWYIDGQGNESAALYGVRLRSCGAGGGLPCVGIIDCALVDRIYDSSDELNLGDTKP